MHGGTGLSVTAASPNVGNGPSESNPTPLLRFNQASRPASPAPRAGVGAAQDRMLRSMEGCCSP